MPAHNLKKVLYFDCFSGCSGDMLLGALLDAGLPLKTLEKGLKRLGLSGYSLEAEKVKKHGIAAMQMKIVIDDAEKQPQRSLKEIIELIDGSKLQRDVKKMACRIFHLLAEVEAEIHCIKPEKVIFHEIGAVDSIIDIVGCAIGFHYFRIDKYYSSPMPAGSGTVRSAHGILPLPAPATLKLLARAGAPLAARSRIDGAEGELVTPTGAAVITSLASFDWPGMTVSSVGCGAGTREYGGWANIMRIWVGEEQVEVGDEDIILLETNIDDMNPEIYGFIMQRLFEAKAYDVWLTPIYMKKNRPAVMLSVLAARELEGLMTEIIMSETSTLGVRVRKVDRHTVQRDIIQFESSLGSVRAKVKRLQGRVTGISPEYEDCAALAVKKQMPLREIYRIVEDEAHAYIEKKNKQK